MSEMSEKDNAIRAAVALKGATEIGAAILGRGVDFPWSEITALAEYLYEWLESKEASGEGVGSRPHAASPPPQYQAPQPSHQASNGSVKCPQCGSDMWDNRPKKATGEYKQNAADFTCKANREHKIWPVRD